MPRERSGMVLRPRDLLNLAGALTLLRLPLAVVFPFVAGDPGPAIAVYAAAQISDVLDGPVARRTGTASPAGAFADGWLDKIFHIQAAWSLGIVDRMPFWWMLLWFSRELIQGALVPWYVHRYLQGHAPPNAPTWLGRLTTILLAAAFVTTILGLKAIAWPITVAVGILGALTAAGYLRREVEDLTRRR